MATTEFDAEKYRRASRHQKEWGRRLIDELDLQGNERVLDLGCGDGVLTVELARRVPRGFVLGIDASPNMVKTAAKMATYNLEFRLLDINDMAFDAEFDVVFSNATLQWIKDHRRLLAVVRQALRNGGYLRFQFAGDGNCAVLIAILQEAMYEAKFRRSFTAFEWPWFMPSSAEYQALVDSAGFAESRTWVENADRFFSNADEMVQWVEQPCLVPFLAVLSESDRQAFRNKVVEKMIARTRQADGSCFETFRRINVFARK